ncbi:AbrB/MazE/SpoVT family DNA-binding domain-containing protein [Clostridium cellulovorans]|uniref:Transcriptional regulator, AbrB family n=1 Tax=Clostridium cellulovorans (strain ATCC 35296 / DSM 3052 / OCM 3 / 743B) TaxID=573061 RepID=D9SWG5_CLOC7|nr:AbrB/MazE/SpoVT family DNA-binding domain-containing protein [Clostridium cellulovorans]ADL53247.1 transcriptional regulator, AbrB family [Clostridium cellulovorans 743B]
MKSTGVVRKLDQLGRIVFPIELRRTLEIEVGDGLEIFTENETIILKKHQPGCIFCGNVRNVTYLKGKCICKECKEELKNESF